MSRQSEDSSQEKKTSIPLTPGRQSNPPIVAPNSVDSPPSQRQRTSMDRQNEDTPQEKKNSIPQNSGRQSNPPIVAPNLVDSPPSQRQGSRQNEEPPQEKKNSVQQNPRQSSDVPNLVDSPPSQRQGTSMDRHSEDTPQEKKNSIPQNPGRQSYPPIAPNSPPSQRPGSGTYRQNEDPGLEQEVAKFVDNSFPQNPGQQPQVQNQQYGQQPQINQVQNQQYNEQSQWSQPQQYQPSQWGPGQQSWGQQYQQYDQQSQFGPIQQYQPSQWGQNQQYGGQNSGGSNPCCCDLQNGVLCAAIYGIVFYAIYGIYFALAVASIQGISLGSDFDFSTESDIGKAYIILSVVAMLVGFVTSIVLTVGATSKSAITVKVGFAGFIFTIILFLLVDALYVVNLSQMPESVYVKHHSSLSREVGIAINVLATLIMLAVYVYVLYAIWVYMGQLTKSGQKVGNIGGGQGQPAYGQFPVGVPPPSQQQSYYQPAAPNVGYSQTTMNPGGYYPTFY